MKQLYLYSTLFLFFIPLIGFGQTVCPPTGITTHPDRPVNTENSAMLNDFFDWRDFDWQDYMHESYYGIGGVQPNFPTRSPYWSSEVYLQYLSGYYSGESTIDYAPEEGWELITRSLGKKIDGTQNTEFYFPYVLLYNKYTGKLRMFFNIPSVDLSQQQIVIARLAFNEMTSQSKPKVTGLLGHNAGVSQPLDQKTDVTYVEGVSNLVHSGWNHVEFVVGYDPCTCVKNGEELLNPTSISATIQLVETATVEMTGRLIGTVTDPYFSSNQYQGNELSNVIANGFSNNGKT